MDVLDVLDSRTTANCLSAGSRCKRQGAAGLVRQPMVVVAMRDIITYIEGKWS